MRHRPFAHIPWLLLCLVWCAVAGEQIIEAEQLRVTLDPAAGTVGVLDKEAGVRWLTFAGLGRIVMRNLAPTGRLPGVTFETELPAGGGRTLEATVTVTVPESRRDVQWAIAADDEAAMSWVPWPPPLVPEKGESWLAIAPYGDGLLVPLRRDQLPRRWWPTDMSCVGVIAGSPSGPGYALVFETPDDARLLVRPTSKAKDAPMAASVTWSASHKKWGYARKLLYRFCPTGGYVAVAKAYRQYAKDTGLLVTLREKMKRKPDVAKLAGAPDVWGAKGLAFCKEAKAAGIDRMIVNGSFGVEDTEAIKKLGYLVSTYDNYEDMMAGKPGRAGDCTIPDDAPLMANGKRMLGWPVHVTDPKTGKTQLDPKTGKPVVKERYYKRCSARALAVAKRWVPPDQARNPRNARFIDVATATELRECFDPRHPCTRSVDREHKLAVARYIGDELGLVLGGEHGKWWGVPVYDYWEGMQSGGFYSWPAGHVGMDIPQTRQEIGGKYLTYGIGHVHRIPFWELVFGDCVVSTWYWGDSTGHLYQADPDISRRKDLFNMLYGTVPLYWVSRPFSFRWDKPALRARLLDSYRVTCKLHEHTAFDELLTHEWLTADRTVQRTTFSSGTFVVVNFGRQVYEQTHDGKAYPLAPLGFLAAGPAVLQYRIRQDGGDITYIKTPDCLFADAGGKEHDFGAVVTEGQMTLRTVAADLLRGRCVPGGGVFAVRPERIVPEWDAARTHYFALNREGQRAEEFRGTPRKDAWGWWPKGEFRFEVATGERHDLPNLAVSVVHFTRAGAEKETARRIGTENGWTKQGQKQPVAARVWNTGARAVKRAEVSFFVAPRKPDRVIATRQVDLEPGASVVVTCELNTLLYDGQNHIEAVADPDNRIAELIETDNESSSYLYIAADWSRWKYHLIVEVSSPVKQLGDPVVLPIDLGAQLRRLGGEGTIDPASVRMRFPRKYETDMDFQFEPAPGFDGKANAKGELVWFVYSLRPEKSQTFWVYFDTVENGPKSRSRAARRWDAETQTVETSAYWARLRDGCIVELARHEKEGYRRRPGKSFLAGLVYSSQQTGWVQEEDGELLEQKVLADGPERTVVRVRKKLKAGMVYTKTYTFWPGRIDVQSEGNKAYGLMSRAYYVLPGTYEDSAGNKAKVEGSGDGEGVIGKCPDPKWYVVYGEGWAHSCVALSRFDNIVYWDANSWGGIGFSGGDIQGARMSYVIHGAQKDASFGKRDYERLMHPPKARIVE